jgi:hypothetical protein
MEITTEAWKVTHVHTLHTVDDPVFLFPRTKKWFMSWAVILRELWWEGGASTGCRAARVAGCVAPRVLEAAVAGVFELRGRGIYSSDESEFSSERLRSKCSLPLSVGCMVGWLAHAGWVRWGTVDAVNALSSVIHHMGRIAYLALGGHCWW